MPSAPVTISQLVKVYQSKGGGEPVRAVRCIDLEIREGEFMVLVGPSGCGKSTVLRMLAGLEEITEGEIRIGDRVVNDLEPKERGIAMVFQDYALYPHMTVYGNMAFGLKLSNRPKGQIEKKVSEAADILGLTDLLTRKPRELSGGQRQRVALGRAIVRDPSVFLFDEPLSNLDAKMRVQMRSEIAQLHKRLGTTMVYVTHDQVEAMTMGDRICVMNDGEIIQVADPLTLYREPKTRFVASFIGSPPMNLLDGRLQRGTAADEILFVEDSENAEGIEPLRLPLPDHLRQQAQTQIDRPVTLGIRPDHLNERENGATTFGIERPVRLVEPMGFETLVHLKTASGHLIARVSPDFRLAPSDPFRVWLDLDKARLFDSGSDLRNGSD